MRIAIIGSGIAGLGASYLLKNKVDVHLYENADRFGGHSNTVDAIFGGIKVPVDTGFIVYNEMNYPNLTALFNFLDVPTEASEMSFSASLDDGLFEYSGTNLNGLFGQRVNIVRPRFWQMMRGILRFYREAPSFLAQKNDKSMSLGEYLAHKNYHPAFINDHLLPMGAAIWSTTSEEIKAYPADAFIRFFQSHGLLNIIRRPSWRTVTGGSREYVKLLSAQLKNRTVLDAVVSVSRKSEKVEVKTKGGESLWFDLIVMF